MSLEGERYQKLEVWQLADQLALEVYRETRSFPREEMYGLTRQVRNSALSIPTNIVEGYSKRGDRELTRYVDIALGSLGETRYLLSFAQRLEYLSDQSWRKLEARASELARKLWVFYDKIRPAK